MSDLSLLLPPLAAGLLVLATHVPMGRVVLARGIIFIDLAIAQIAGLGVIAANSLGWEAHGWTVQMLAVSAALAGALLLIWTEKRFNEVQEALIGVLFILAATGGILLLAGNPHGGEHLRELLVGQILWTGWSHLLPATTVTAVILGVWAALGERAERRAPFYLLFAVTVTVSVQLVGVYLVFASLIIPALVVRGLAPSTALPWAYAVGTLGYAIGLMASLRWDWPTGAIIVWSMAAVALASLPLRRLTP